MTDFDFQWKNLLDEKDLKNEEEKFECNQDRVKEFLELTGIKPWYKKDSFIKNKKCLDAGCGPGRWTCAMQKLGASKVDSFDMSEEGIKRCKKINPSAYVSDIWDLEPNREYYNVSMPDYMNLTYEFTIWTSYIEQMNKIVEKINYSDGAYWGEPGKMKFKSSIESFSDASQIDGEKLIQTTFSVNLYGYILPETFD